MISLQQKQCNHPSQLENGHSSAVAASCELPHIAVDTAPRRPLLIPRLVLTEWLSGKMSSREMVSPTRNCWPTVDDLECMFVRMYVVHMYGFMLVSVCSYGMWPFLLLLLLLFFQWLFSLLFCCCRNSCCCNIGASTLLLAALQLRGWAADSLADWLAGSGVNIVNMNV